MEREAAGGLGKKDLGLMLGSMADARMLRQVPSRATGERELMDGAAARGREKLVPRLLLGTTAEASSLRRLRAGSATPDVSLEAPKGHPPTPLLPIQVARERGVTITQGGTHVAGARVVPYMRDGSHDVAGDQMFTCSRCSRWFFISSTLAGHQDPGKHERSLGKRKRQPQLPLPVLDGIPVTAGLSHIPYSHTGQMIMGTGSWNPPSTRAGTGDRLIFEEGGPVSLPASSAAATDTLFGQIDEGDGIDLTLKL